MDRGEQYQMKPRPGAKFSKVEVEKMIQKVLKDRFADQPYVWDNCQQQSKEATADIQKTLEEMGYNRYKLIVQLTIVEAANQGLRIASRCLWDPDVDNFAEYTLSTTTMHVNAVAFALYWE